MSLSIIISEPDRPWRDKTNSFLISHNFQTKLVASGKECQIIASKRKYYGVVLDFDTQAFHSLAVLKFLKTNHPSMKVVMTFKSHDFFKELDFTDKELRKLGVDYYFIKPFELNKLLEVLEEEEKLQSWKTVEFNEVNVTKVTKPGEEEHISDNKFTGIKIDDYVQGSVAIFDTFVKIRKDTYVKVFNKGDRFDQDRIKTYVKKGGLLYLYFKTADRAVYLNYVNNILEKVSQLKTIDEKVQVKLTMSVSEQYIEEVYLKGLKPSIVHEGQKLCDNMYRVIERQKNLKHVLDSFKEIDIKGFKHQFAVSLIAVAICKNLKWNSRRTTQNICMGGLLHDIGKLKIPKGLLEKRPLEMNPEELKEYKKHPLFGAQMLENTSHVPESVRQIVYQHHEYNNGKGFPNGLAGLKIYPMAKIICLADSYVHFLSESTKSPQETLENFVLDRNIVSLFDSEILKSLILSHMK